MGFGYNYANEYDIEGVRKTVNVTSLFNNDAVCEFQLPVDKRALYLPESNLHFSIEIPEEFVPDNGFCSKS